MLTAQSIKANCSMAIIRWLRIKMPYEYLTMDITTYNISQLKFYKKQTATLVFTKKLQAEFNGAIKYFV